MNQVIMSLEFSGLVLPVGKDTQEREIVPVRPVSDLFGLSWTDQHKRLNRPNWAKRLGTCIGDIPHAGQQRDMTCIRLDRVASFLYSINPDKVRAAGNVKGADFLEQKQEEWDNLLHEYEVAGGILSKNEILLEQSRLRTINTFLSVNREKRLTQTLADRQALAELAHGMAGELGVPYQLDLDDTEALVQMAREADALQDKTLRTRVIRLIDARLRKAS